MPKREVVLCYNIRDIKHLLCVRKARTHEDSALGTSQVTGVDAVLWITLKNGNTWKEHLDPNCGDRSLTSRMKLMLSCSLCSGQVPGCCSDMGVPGGSRAGNKGHHEPRTRCPSISSVFHRGHASTDDGYTGLLGGDLQTVFPTSDTLF